MKLSYLICASAIIATLGFMFGWWVAPHIGILTPGHTCLPPTYAIETDGKQWRYCYTNNAGGDWSYVTHELFGTHATRQEAIDAAWDQHAEFLKKQSAPAWRVEPPPPPTVITNAVTLTNYVTAPMVVEDAPELPPTYALQTDGRHWRWCYTNRATFGVWETYEDGQHDTRTLAVEAAWIKHKTLLGQSTSVWSYAP